MSKTKADLAKFLSAPNEQLFDRYINITLAPSKEELDDPDAPKAAFSAFSASDYNRYVSDLIASRKNRLTIITPKTGVKPHVCVAGTLSAGARVHSITATIFNISEQIDTMAYNWAKIEAGYYNSGVHVTFEGRIINCYMAKPNPNGELVITIATADMVSLYEQGDIEVQYENEQVDIIELLETAFKVVKDAFPDLVTLIDTAELENDIPDEWKEEKFKVCKATRHYRSVMELIAWLNSLFATYSHQTGFASGAGLAPIVNDKGESKDANLPPIKLGFDTRGFLHLSGSFTDSAAANYKTLNGIGNAFLSGDAATVQAPFNPGVLPGDVVFIDVKYFKTRVSMEGISRERYANKGNLWWVISSQFVFDTHKTNTMTLLLNNTENPVSATKG